MIKSWLESRAPAHKAGLVGVLMLLVLVGSIAHLANVHADTPPREIRTGPGPGAVPQGPVETLPSMDVDIAPPGTENNGQPGIADSLSMYSYSALLGELLADPPQGPPLLPSAFWGAAKAGGANVSEGTAVSAWIDNVQVARTATTLYSGDSVSSLDIPADDTATPKREGGNEGEIIRFKIGSTWSNETGEWHSGDVSNRNLSIPAYSTHFGTASWWINSFRQPSQDQYPRMLADVNGDGRADIVLFHPTKGVKVALSTGNDFGTPSRWSSEFKWSSQNESPRMLADVDGDGKADIVGFRAGKGVYVALSTGSGFDNSSQWANAFGQSSQDQYPRLVADVNGDGQADIVLFHPEKGVRVALSSGNGFGMASRWSIQFKSYSSQNQYPRMLADVDGDGMADIVGFDPGEGVQVALSTGSAFSPPSRWHRWFRWSNQDEAPRMMADVDGDGRADIVGFQPGVGVKVALSTGSRFGSAILWSKRFRAPSQEEIPRMVADISGDGRADIAKCKRGAGVQAAISTPE